MWLVTAFLFLTVVLLWIRHRLDHFRYFKKLGVPGPKPSILFGNLLEIYKKGARNCYSEWTQTYGPICGYFSGPKPVLLVTDLDIIKRVFIKDFTSFVDRSRLFVTTTQTPHAITQLQGQRWKEMRSILTPAFTSSKLKSMAPLVNETIDELIENVSKNAHQQSFDVYPLYKALTCDIICRCAMGIRYDIQKDPLKHPILESMRASISPTLEFSVAFAEAFPWMKYIMKAIHKFSLSSRTSDFRNPIKSIVDECKKVITMRRTDSSLRRNDLLQLLIEAGKTKVDYESVSGAQLTAGDEADAHQENIDRQAVQNGDVQNGFKKASGHDLTDDELSHNGFISLIAGFETTSSALAIITHLLVHHPEIQERLRAEIMENASHMTEQDIDYDMVNKLPYLEAVISEALRVYPPVYGFTTRAATCDKDYGKVKILKGLRIVAPTHCIHQAEQYWEDAHVFNPDRMLPENKKNFQGQAWQPFGLGPRNCIGMRFAQMNLKITLTRLLKKFRFSKTAETSPDPPEFYTTTVLSTLKRGVFVKVDLL